MQKFLRFLFDLTPEFILIKARDLKTRMRKRSLLKQAASGQIITKDQLIRELTAMNIRKGDSLMVHASLSRIGYIEGGADTVIDALLDTIGISGTLLMPAFPAPGRNKDYLLSDPVFDIRNTKSQMGIISETFRKRPGIKRSFHPTDSVIATGPLAEYYTSSHFGRPTPYDSYSPFYKLCEKDGKILMLGTTLNGACTNLHVVEDAIPFKYPVYEDKIYETRMRDENGTIHKIKTRVHNPDYSVKRNADALLPLFLEKKVLTKHKAGNADCLLINAKAMLEVMINAHNESGITMYSPYGNKKG